MPVTPQMVAIALGQVAPEPTSVTEQQWQMWIYDAEMLIEARKLELGHTDLIDAARSEYVVREAVVAHIKKPDDATQVTISVDDGSSTRAYQSSKGRVSILDEWWALLGLTPKSSGAYSIDMVGSTSAHLPWCALTFGALYCSCGTDIAGHPIYEISEQ
jgi:hypothetical protein